MHVKASRTTAEGLWVAVVCGAAVGVAMAAGAPLLVAVANTPPEVSLSWRSVFGLWQLMMTEGLQR